ncbi:P-loop NTPase fold protein [Lentzea sp. NPDC051213]|uniref:KAP family P-loop NTPase fold protein n=1 Tax=Lentzea sp. NPDC051213 TaxID=3364126 RepID=UPI00378F1E29
MSDQPATKDELGFDRFTEPLARTIAEIDRRSTPWTVGVYGEWGSGKTTFLRLVETKLREEGVRPIWFNAWKYSRDDNLWAALIEKIVVDARRSVPWYRVPDVRLRIWLRSIDLRAGFFELFRKLLAIAFKVAMLAALILVAVSLVPVTGNPVTGWFANKPLLADPLVRVLVGVVAALGTKPEALLKLFDVRLGADLGAFRRRRAHRSQTALIDDFTAEFQGVLKIVYPKKPLVVIIDDLDRCLPEQTLQIIETIKLFLDEEGCVFLLAVDREVIEHAIRVKYQDLPAVGELGETFFEKIVQLPYSLPPPAAGKVDSYIRTMSPDPDVLACLPILRGTAPYNPRRIKRNVQACDCQQTDRDSSARDRTWTR